MEMEGLIQGFREEAAELIVNMEESLLVLETDANNDEAIASIFRVMHTLKGSGGMFGFTSVTSFTHLLENIYDKIRSEKLQLNDDILNLTFESVDLIKNLMLSTDDPQDEIKKEYDRLIFEFENVCQKDDHKPISPEPESIPSLPKTINQASYYIFFSPNEDIMKNGTNPLYLIDELVSLGEGRVFAHIDRVPTFPQLNPQICTISWDIILSTDVELSEILDVFIFVEDDSKIDIQKISDINVLSQAEFIKKLPDYIGTASDSAIIELQEFALQIEKNISQSIPIQPNIIDEPSTIQKEELVENTVHEEKAEKT
ncbi:MAG: hypothetical protein GQ527_06675, partial [Bacteroidales bacterium]|nr:hypothetical protein [Bacteroidales bacterium]